MKPLSADKVKEVRMVKPRPFYETFLYKVLICKHTLEIKLNAPCKKLTQVMF